MGSPSKQHSSHRLVVRWFNCRCEFHTIRIHKFSGVSAIGDQVCARCERYHVDWICSSRAREARDFLLLRAQNQRCKLSRAMSFFFLRKPIRLSHDIDINSERHEVINK